ncbi:hypothetical protein [Knoellia koreensis]|uniref:Peptidase n=1 Tax=Knoellia koreensis TaxID=2730921 RepID=A0A849H8K8_9MICO|nr:hypothetical protein [Knoellia sp. DB2414S]NNM46066.1 hypothetical protein [Knoellia sp. DB2414S]
MHRTSRTTLRSARPAAVAALAVGLALLVPGSALAGTTAPTPVTTTTAPAPTETTSPTTGTGSTGSTTTATGGTGTGTGSGSTTTTSDSSTTGTPSSSPKSTSSPSSPSSSSSSTSAPSPRLVPGGNAQRYGMAAAAGPATSTDPTLVAAHYLVQELVRGEHHFSTVVDGVGTFADYGVTADAVLALDAAGAGQTEATATTSYLAEHAVDYIGFGDKTEVAAGPVAKLLLVASAQGVDPRAFGGYDLVATLESLAKPNGKYADQSKYGDYSNLFSQSLAIMALDRAGRPVPAQAVSFLRAQQCPGGGFRLFYPATGDQGAPCTDATAADPDATAMAVQALIAVASTSDSGAAAGLDYLASRQGADGGIGGGGPQTQRNANTTGLAGQAFLAGGRKAQARLAAEFLGNLQYDCSFPSTLRGGIAYDQTAFGAQKAAGSKAEPADQDRRSTTQAILALAGTPLYAVSATGADANAPALTCAAPTTSTSGTPSTSSSSSSSTSSSTDGTSTTAAPGEPGEPGAGGSGDAGNQPVASSTPAGLAFTGANLAVTLALAVLLLAAGAAAIAVARRKGSHA